MKFRDLILQAREERYENIKALFKDNLICVKANIPGDDKQIPIAYILIRIFKNEIIKLIKVQDIYYFDSYDGPYYLISVEKDENVKRTLLMVEENHPLGRFIDLDFFTETGKSVYRQDLNLPPRKCYLCQEDVLMCIRQKRHTVRELLTYLNTGVNQYLDTIIENFVDEAILKELNLDFKFGLVTPTTSGSHPDMDYDLMIKAKNAIIPYIKEMFWIGYNHDDLDSCFTKAKVIGILAENDMFIATKGINAYKGLIFILGLAVTSAGYVLKHNQDLDDLFSNIKIMTKGIFKNLNDETFGVKAYQEYQFGGAREEAQSGLINVQAVYQSFKELSDEELHMALINIIKNTNDSVMLKRAKTLEKYQYFKKMITNIQEYNLEKIKQITNECISENISCGGAADILIAAIFISQFAKMFKK